MANSEMMNKEPLVSVVVPVYKAEKYLHRCVDSILAQTINDIELILVDDGSPDNCGSICDEYAKKDSRVRVIHRSNGGVSSARNAGIDISNGKWLCFVDSDDYVDRDYLQHFHLEKSYADLHLQGYTVLDNDAKTYHTFKSEEYDNVVDVLAEAEDEYIMNSPCFKLFLRDIVVKNHILFDTKVSYGEDHLFSLSYYLYVKELTKSSNHGYINVRNGNESLTRRLIPVTNMLYYTEEALRLQKQIMKAHSNNSKRIVLSVNQRFFKNIKRAFYDSIERSDLSNDLQAIRNTVKKIVNVSMVMSFKDFSFLLLLSYLPIPLLIIIIKIWKNI